MVAAADLGRLVSATYPLARYQEAIEHAADAGRRGAVKIAFDLRDEKERTDEEEPLMPRPGFVLDVDRSTPPTLFHHGESFRLEKLPAGRAGSIYPAEPLDPASRTSTAPIRARARSTRSATATRCRRCCTRA